MFMDKRDSLCEFSENVTAKYLFLKCSCYLHLKQKNVYVKPLVPLSVSVPVAGCNFVLGCFQIIILYYNYIDQWYPHSPGIRNKIIINLHNIYISVYFPLGPKLEAHA